MTQGKKSTTKNLSNFFKYGLLDIFLIRGSWIFHQSIFNKLTICYSIAIGVASMVPVVLYPLAKRVTQFPQLVLGLTFNIGAIMGYTAVTGHLNLQTTFLLYMSCIMWTLHYDTIYAMQVRNFLLYESLVKKN